MKAPIAAPVGLMTASAPAVAQRPAAIPGISALQKTKPVAATSPAMPVPPAAPQPIKPPAPQMAPPIRPIKPIGLATASYGLRDPRTGALPGANANGLPTGGMPGHDDFTTRLKF